MPVLNLSYGSYLRHPSARIAGRSRGEWTNKRRRPIPTDEKTDQELEDERQKAALSPVRAIHQFKREKS